MTKKVVWMIGIAFLAVIMANNAQADEISSYINLLKSDGNHRKIRNREMKQKAQSLIYPSTHNG